MSGDDASAARAQSARGAASTALRLAFLTAAGVALADQASKWLVADLLAEPPGRLEVTGFLNLVRTFNYGISFGLMGGVASWKPWLLSALAVGIVTALFVWLRRQPLPLLGLAVGLVAGGAVGNTIDRLRFGAVLDFLDFHAGDWHWFTFNLADSAISVGVALMVWDGLFRGRAGARK